MLSALSEAEFCLKDAALLAAISRRRASCRCRSGRSKDFSLVTALFCRTVFFGTGAGGFEREDLTISQLLLINCNQSTSIMNNGNVMLYAYIYSYICIYVYICNKSKEQTLYFLFMNNKICIYYNIYIYIY